MRNLFDFLICAILQFTPNRAYDEAAVGSAAVAQFVCPVTLLEFGGRYPFVAIRCTGYVLAEKAIKEVGLEGLQVNNPLLFYVQSRYLFCIMEYAVVLLIITIQAASASIVIWYNTCWKLLLFIIATCVH
jgi:Rtf2 RING-finger